MAFNNAFQPYPFQAYNVYPQMQQMPVQAQQPQQTIQQTGGYTVRPVGSRDEAVAAQVDYFGSGAIMPDLGHGMVYLKRFNSNTGASDFIEFAYKPPETVSNEPKTVADYVTVKEYNNFKDEILRRFSAFEKGDENK